MRLKNYVHLYGLMLMCWTSYTYLSEGIFSLMVAETNRFAQQFFANIGNEGTSNYSRKWEPVDINEMKRFIGAIWA